jgi:endo-1,4-beta-xylanase
MEARPTPTRTPRSPAGERAAGSGPEVGQTLVSQQSLGVGEQQTYVLRVIDTFAQADEDVTHVAVVDTTPPNLSVTVSPAVLSPPNHKLAPITVTIVATDTCDANPVVRLVSIMSNEADNGLGDGDQPNDIQGAAFGTDDRQFQLRNERSGNGSGRIYTITYSATDASGNTTVRQATVTVPR